LVLDAQGRSQRYSRSVGSMGERRGPHVMGPWQASNGVLRLSSDAGTVEHVYRIAEGVLCFPNDSRFTIWHRV
jgi:hypothetical protein